MSAHQSTRGVFVNREVFGGLVRAERRRAGFSDASDMSDYLTAIGFPIHKNTIYRVERGLGDISFETFIALSVAMPRLLDFEYLKPALIGAARNPSAYSLQPADSAKVIDIEQPFDE